MRTGRSRKTPIIVLSIIFGIIAIICGVIYAVIATDLFYDNRQAFFVNIFRSFFSVDESSVNSGEYFSKLNSTQIKNSGNLVVNVNNENIEEKLLDVINNFTVDFSGDVNVKDKLYSQNIILNYSEKENFPILIKKDYDEFGYKPGKIILKYIILKEFDDSVEKPWEDEEIEENPYDDNMDIDSSFKQSFKLGKVSPYLFDKKYYNDTEYDEIKNKFVKIVEEEISKDKFKKEKNGKEKIYSVEFNEGNEFSNICKRMIEEVINTDEMISKINFIITDKKLNMEFAEKEDIESYIENIENIENMDNSNLKFKISYVKKGRQISKIIFENDLLKLSLQNDVDKNTTNYVKYDLCAELKGDQFFEGSDLIKIDLGIEYDGIEKLEKITEKYKLKIAMVSEGNEKKSISYNLVNNVEFKPENKIEQFTKNEVIKLSQYTPEQEENFMSELNRRTQKYQERQMLRLGLNKDERIEKYLNPLIALGEGNNNFEEPENSGIFENNEEDSNKKETSNSGQNLNKDESSNKDETENKPETNEEAKVTYTEQEKEKFNKTYKDYESEKSIGENVISLIQKINLNNINAKDKNTQVIKITLDGNEITNERSISNSSYYKITAQYAENGLISEMKINTIN